MKKVLFVLLSVLVLLFYNSCKKEDPYDYNIDYQDDYPNVMAGYWKAYDYEFTDDGLILLDYDFYDLVTALDPNNKNSLIIDNIYNSNQRVRTFIDRANNEFYATRGQQMEKENAGFDIETISVEGEYIDDPEAGEILVIILGLYDKYGDLYDSVLTVAFRKTGFEDVDEYEYDYIFENSND